MRSRFQIVIAIVVLMAGGILTGCTSGAGSRTSHTDLSMAETGSMPLVVRAAPGTVTDAYRFAAANPDVLQKMPCYCGCGAMGHESNYDCFWQSEDKMDAHALGCGICVDIAQDAMSGLEQGQTLADIRQQIDGDYSRFGPSTNTPPVATGSL